ncbi:hypothetical protein GTP41_13205 [Pseudoduganella sp. DS3]|uniref:Big-1 domain-containing protein n=1 Tax=Pseudoduganella guangdongensis TaxID=2692179 RepID=A0A6N9HHH3_9BURK|nr:hypothetical protein [Pseudoduganella guangdongensis]
MLTQLRLNSLVNFLVACLLAGLLAACGGGGSVNDGCVNVDPSRPSILPGCGTSTNPGTGTSTNGTITLALVDSAGAPLLNLMPDSPGIVKVVLKDARSVVVADAVVSFTTTDNTAVLSPSSGTALTDASGNASIKLAPGTQAGAFTLTATATVAGAALKATKTYTVSFPALTLSDMVITPSTLSAGGNASVTISVKSGTANYTQPVSVAFTSACVATGKATLGTPVVTQNGTAIASYTDKGCGTTDTLTATVVVPNATLTKSGTINVLPAIAGSIKFLSVDTTNIALKGTGGLGRPEHATLTYQVFDKNGSPVAGKLVTFQFADTGTTTATGGLALNPVSATTGADGTVTTSVAGGTIPTSIRVTATVDGSSPVLTTVSSHLVVSSGVPDIAHLTMGITIGNCEGWDYNQECGMIEVLAGDHFSNLVPDGTVVNFSTEGGVIEDSCKTVKGRCQVSLFAANPRPANGQLTVLAYMTGEESFTDSNGNNVYDAGEPFTDLRPDAFRDDNEDGSWSPGEPCISSLPNSTCSASGDGVYNGVLRVPQVKSAQVQYISKQFVAQFSTSKANITFGSGAITCSNGGTTDVQVTVADLNGNWMPFNTVISFSTLFGTVSTTVIPASTKVPNVVLGVGEAVNLKTYTATIACPTPAGTGQFIVKVTSPLGEETIAKKQIN